MGQRLLSQRLLSGTILEEQIRTEREAVREGVRRYRRLVKEALDREEAPNLKPVERLLLHWYRPMLGMIKLERAAIRRRVDGSLQRRVYGPVFMLLDAERTAVIAMHETVSACMIEPGGALVAKVAYAIGRAILAEIHSDIMRRTKVKVHCSDGVDREYSAYSQIQRRVKRITPLLMNNWANKTLGDPVWSRRVSASLGIKLLWMLVECASTRPYTKDGEFNLAFHHERKPSKNGNLPAYVRMDDEAFDIIDKGHEVRQYMRPRYLPMLVDPYPWTADAQGGYTHIRTPLVSKPSPSQAKAIESADMTRVFEALAAVNSTAWRINSRMLGVIRRLWDQGGGAIGIPPADNLHMPPPVDSDDPDVIARNKSERKKVWDKNIALKSVRHEFLGKLHVATEFADRVIYFPHQMDFRGRTYPIPVHLNHQGDDVARGLLEFAEAKPATTAEAHGWLRVHAANLYGVDKCSYHERKAWAIAHQREIEQCADDPFSSTAWSFWTAADSPMQFLAACFALSDPDAAAHLPVHRDGTCNGLQHYAALLRDEQGAASVNLIAGDTPADIYSEVAELTRRRVGVDADDGDAIAALVYDMIDRKMVKHPTMTSVYGVTMVGAREQVYARLREAECPDDMIYRASSYLSRVTLDSLRQVCVGAASAMDWLRASARSITSKHKRDTIQWLSPLGFPIVQPYRKFRSIHIATIMQNLTLRVHDDTLPVAPGRQMDGIAPNFIHSIDATHMMMTAVRAKAANISFAAVHDSYWCHAADASKLDTILREQFVELHQQPLLQQLTEQFRRSYPKAQIADPPAAGNFDLSSVLDSPYFFH